MLKRTLRKGDYKSEFPIYADDLGRRFEIAGNQRLDALNVGEIVTMHFTDFNRKVGPFNRKIAEYLSNEDIKSLRKAAIQIMDRYDESYGEGAVASNYSQVGMEALRFVNYASGYQDSNLIHQKGSQPDSRLNDVGIENFATKKSASL